MKKIWKWLSKYFKSDEYPSCLRINGRLKLPTTEFQGEHKLYRGYSGDDLGEEGEIDIDAINFPDFSCNWSRFSDPEHVRFRENGKSTDGCYSFTVAVARFQSIATPVHDPISDDRYENYAHTEVRLLGEGESIFSEPPKNKPKKRSSRAKSERMKYRQNIMANLMIEIEPGLE
jgi:hypothetical protein